MKITNAKISDAEAIHGLISEYAEVDRMLFRDPADIYEHLQTFVVARNEQKVVGCCALHIIWNNLAEIKSLAVSKEYMGKGVGRELVQKQLSLADELGISNIFTLTLEPVFFEKLGFKKVNKQALPMKVWSDCARCPKQNQCDEVAMMYNINGNTDQLV